MSRGSNVYYLATQPNTGDLTNSINTIINPTVPQKGDIAISTYAQADGAVTADLSSFVTANDAYQYNGSSWAAISTRETIWTDPTLVANVTKIRLAHTEESRNYQNFVQKMYGRRYGDSWFNKHNMSKAILEWYQDTDTARIYMANWGGDQSYLTIECGDNVDDRIRFANRQPASLETAVTIVDIAGNEFRSYVPGYFQMDLTAEANFYVSGTSEFTGHAQFLSTINVDGAATLFSLWVETVSTFVGDALFQSDAIVQQAIRPSTSPSQEVDRGIEWGSATRIIADNAAGSIRVEASSAGQTVTLRVPDINSVKLEDGTTVHTVLTTGHEGHGGGIDSDTVDGWHLSQILAEDIVIEYNGTSMKDSDNNRIGYALVATISGVPRYFPSWPDPGGCTCTCPCPCQCPCKSECDCWD